MDKYVSVARRVGGRLQNVSSGGSTRPDRDLAAIREWAPQNGYKVSSRGRIPNDVMAAYEAAN